MDATQMINDSILESDEEENEEESKDKRGQPLAKLCILQNEHIPAAELPLFLGDNVLGRDPNTCTLLFPAPSVSKQHATICISVYRRRGCHSEVDMEALVWDQGSMNGTRMGRLKLTSNVRYALSEGERLVVADIPCQYVSCTVNTVSSQGDIRTPVSRNEGVKARLPDASREKGGDTSTGSKKCVNGGTKPLAMMSSLDLEDTRKTRTTCLSFEQTPTQPEGTLVPESESDSDGERGVQGDGRRKPLVSDSDSHKSSPTCSTFLSPTNKIVPESEDESPITPSSSAKNRPYRHVSFSKEEPDIDVGRQQLKKKGTLAIVDDSEEEEESKEERATPGGTTFEESGQDVLVEQENNVSLTREEELPVSTRAFSTDVIPAFNMDSDTDMEGEEESVTLNTNQQADQPPNTVHFHMDSDTDVDEDEDTFDKGPKSMPSPDDISIPPHAVPVIQPEGITMDSDIDMDDDSDPTSFLSAHTADSASSTQPKDFHLDSDTDVDEEEENDCGTNNKCSKIDEAPTRIDLKPTGSESAPAAPHSLHLDSVTDDEVIPPPAINEPPVVSAVTDSCTTADAGANNSDTDVEEDSPLVIPVTSTALSVTSCITLAAAQSDSDADTDVDESIVPPAGDGDNPADLKLDSDTDVEDKEADQGEAGEDQIPCLRRENTSGLPVLLLQNCSTPVQFSEGEMEEMETQAFLSPSLGPFGRAVAPAVRPVVLSSCSDSQEDEDFVVAETQSFILQTRNDHAMDPNHAVRLECSGDERDGQSSRGGSFHLGLSGSTHLQCQAQALTMESTQAFVSVGGGVNLEDTQAYAAISTADRTSVGNDPNLEATQAYGGDEEPARSQVIFENTGQVDLALEATQAYISKPYSDSKDETEDDERKHITTAETQPLDFPTSSALDMAETQPVCAFREEESLATESHISSKTERMEEHGEAAQPEERPLSGAPSIAETQPMCPSKDEDSIQGPRKRKVKQLEEETQPITSSDYSAVETQPMATSGNEESDDEDLSPFPRKRKAKQLRLKEEETQTLANSELSAVETQPMDTCEDKSDDEDSIPGPRKKRKAKPLQLEEEQTQPLASSVVPAEETEDMENDDDEESIVGQRRRKAKPLQLEEEETQSLTNSEASTVESQPVRTNTGRPSEAGTSGNSVRSKRRTRAGLREEEKQADSSEPPRRQTRGNKAFPTTRGRGQKSRPDESEEEEEVEQVKWARGKKSMRQQKDNEEEEEGRLDIERNEQQQQGMLGEEKDVTELRQQEREERGRISERVRLDMEKRELEKTERQQREQRERMERERKDREEQERLEAEKAEMLRLEQVRAEKERIERERWEEEEKERADRIQREKEQLERERKEKSEKERLECEKAEREEKERLENERIERKKEKEEKERLETAKRAAEEQERLEREREEQEHQARLEMEEKEREKLEKEKEAEENKEQVKTAKAPARGRRAARRTIAALCTTESEHDSTISTNDDAPARRTRSRSNSSNSVSSERSAASVSTQGSRGRGRGRGAKRTSEPAQPTISRGNNRRRTVAAELSGQRETTVQDSNDISPLGILSRPNSSNSLNSEISICSISSQNRGRGGRQRGRGRKTEPNYIPPVSSQNDQNSAPKPTARGRRSRKAEASSNEVSHEDDKEKADSQQASTTRGWRRANGNGSEPTAADKEGQSSQEEGRASEHSLQAKGNVMDRGQKVVKSVEAPVAPAVSDGDDAKDKRKGRKKALEANTEGAQTAEVARDATIQAKRRGRASSAQGSKNANKSPPEVEVKDESEKMDEEIVERRARGRPSAVQKKKKEAQEESGTCVNFINQDANRTSEPQTPTSSVSRKRLAPPDSSPAAKTPRSSSASPAAGGRLRAANQAYKVLFTGVVDEAGERVLVRLGGTMAKGVADMNCLVTDKVRRTVKFLCAVAKGVPIVTTHWLEKSGKAGSFLSPNAFIVNDPEQEKKFNFCLQESLRNASSQPLLQGYEIHITKSVKPEPVQMKDIISCSGATFLPRMPSSHKPQTVVVSCEEDWSLCAPAVSASLPVVTAEFILTGILQQMLDFQTHKLSVSITNLQPPGGRGRCRKRT